MFMYNPHYVLIIPHNKFTDVGVWKIVTFHKSILLPLVGVFANARWITIVTSKHYFDWAVRSRNITPVITTNNKDALYLLTRMHPYFPFEKALINFGLRKVYIMK